MSSKITFKGRLEQKKAIEYLEQLLDGLKAGAVYVQNEDEYVTLNPTKEIYIEVSASRKKEKEKFSMELSWYSPPEGEANLRISTTEPVIEEKPVPEPEPEKSDA